MLLAAVAMPAGCAAPTPSWDPEDRLPNDWGARVVPTHAGVTYATTTSGEELLADVYLPRAGTPRGVIVFVHGGGFTSGRRQDLHRFAGPLLRQLDRGWAILTIDYRTDRFPAAVLDLDAAIGFLHSDAATELGLGATTVIVAGHSAGGTIAADLALAADRGAEEPFGPVHQVDAWIAIAAPLDLHERTPGGRAAREGWRAGTDPAASPVELLSPGDPPGLVVHGDLDPLVSPEHLRIAAARAQRVGLRGLGTELVELAPEECRQHAPMCGASVRRIDRFVDTA